MNWSDWAESVFGTPWEIWHDGLAIDRFERLSPDERELAVSLLPEGIASGDHVAAVGARMLDATGTLPALTAALDGARGRFLAEAARAIQDLGGDGDSARRAAIAALGRDPVWSHRMDLAIGLRHLTGDGVDEALLAAVAADPEYLVRYHAAESLLHLGGLEPLHITDHEDLFGLVVSDAADDHAAAAVRLATMRAEPSADGHPPQ